jgi:hypothetical protein
MQVRKGKGRKTIRRKGGRKTTRRRRGGMFGMNSGLTQAEKDAIARRSTYGSLRDDEIPVADQYGMVDDLKKSKMKRQMMQGYNQGNTIRNSIMAKTSRRG